MFARVGRESVLSRVEEEEELVECITQLAENGNGITTDELKDIVAEFVEKNQITNPFVNGRPGRSWFKLFKKRNPSIVPRKTEHLTRSRARAEDPVVFGSFFELLHKVLEKAGVRDAAQQIFNADESDFITDPKAGVVLARKGAKNVPQSIGGSGREQITVSCCCSASA